MNARGIGFSKYLALVALNLSATLLLILTTSFGAHSADSTSPTVVNSPDCISQQNPPVKTSRTYKRAGKTQMGTQAPIGKIKARTSSKPVCGKVPKPVAINIPQNNTPQNTVPKNTLNVMTTIVNGANGNQIIVNQVSVPTKAAE